MSIPEGVDLQHLISPALEGRHGTTQHLAKFFTKIEPASSPEKLDSIRQQCQAVAALMIVSLPDGPELSAGLRKLLEAKDCFVRAAL
jgi:hypothetical protein